MVTYYLDAYNIIHCSEPLRSIVHKSVDAARDMLIGMLAEYGALTGEQVILVFDGGSDPSALTDTTPGRVNLSLVYCEGRTSADAYIERAVFETSDRLNVVVVTADRAVAQSVRGMGALVLRPQSFMDQIASTLSECRARKRTPARTKFGAALSERLSEQSRATIETLRGSVSSQERCLSDGKLTKKGRAGRKTTGSQTIRQRDRSSQP